MKNPNAFPSTEAHYYDEHKTGETHHPGMPLRDYFAGQVISNMDISPEVFGNMNLTEQLEAIKNMSGWAYAIADAMLKAREDE